MVEGYPVNPLYNVQMMAGLWRVKLPNNKYEGSFYSPQLESFTIQEKYLSRESASNQIEHINAWAKRRGGRPRKVKE